MNDDVKSGGNPSPGAMLDGIDVLVYARRLDPSCDEEAVRRFAREIAEAEISLNSVDLNDAVPVAAFSPYWLSEKDR